MKNTHATLLAVVVAVAGVSAGQWWSSRQHAAPGASEAQTAQGSAPAQRKVLYYRNPMGLPDTSPTPKKDSMGMDYIPVYEGEADAQAAPDSPGQIQISPQKVQLLGVRTETVGRRSLARTVRASGRVEPDERRISTITARFEGYVERLHVNATGQPVARGQALFDAYSPEMVSAQREYAIAAQGAETLSGDAASGMKQLAESALHRLRNWDLPPEQLEALAKSGQVQRSVTFRSPVAGIVTEKKAQQGMRFMPGEMLYQVTDLGAVWLVADVAEQDIGLLRTGALASVRIDAYPERSFRGAVTYVYPTLKAETRTVPVRIELGNPAMLLKPGMYAQIELAAGNPAPVLAVPESALIDSGTRRIVLVQAAEGRFQPREVRTGVRGDTYVQVLDGVRAGEQVVVSANFLIDSESNLRAAISGMGAAPAGAAGASSPTASSGASAQPAAAAGVVHRAEGTVDEVDAAAGTLSLAHGPVASLKWPAMTMEFKPAHRGLLDGLKKGARIRFEFVERKRGEWVVTAITRVP